MKIYSKQSDEGLGQIIGYECDTCHSQENGEEVPDDWHTIINHYHFCSECYVVCKECNVRVVSKYAESHWKEGLCEECQK